MSLSELKKDSNAVIEKLSGDERFMSRITSIGLTPGCSIRVIRNEKTDLCSRRYFSDRERYL